MFVLHFIYSFELPKQTGPKT